MNYSDHCIVDYQPTVSNPQAPPTTLVQYPISNIQYSSSPITDNKLTAMSSQIHAIMLDISIMPLQRTVVYSLLRKLACEQTNSLVVG